MSGQTTILVMLASLACAAHSSQAFAEDASPSCTSFQQVHPSIGVTCTTSKGFAFTWTEGGWRDDSTRLVWLDWVRPSLSHQDAERACSHGFRLPSGYPVELNAPSNGGESLPKKDSDFVTAEKHGIREVVDFSNRQIWTADVFSAKPVGSDQTQAWTYVFNGRNGKLQKEQLEVRPERNFWNLTAICVYKDGGAR